MQDWLQRAASLFDRPLPNGLIVRDVYRIERLLGAGSYGFAYLVRDESGRLMVLKQLRRSKRLIEAGRQSFRREQHMLRCISHPAVPQLHASFSWDGAECFVMDYIQGQTFEQLIFAEGCTFSEQEAFRILQSILSIVACFHAQGIVHRDLRIPNILLCGEQLHIIDFGLARFISETEERAKSFGGEKKYMREVHYRSDFYALGHFLLFLLYSAYEKTDTERPWYEELSLSRQARHILQRMLQIEAPYEHVKDLLEDIHTIEQG